MGRFGIGWWRKSKTPGFGGGAPWGPRLLFAKGENGTQLEAFARGALFQDAAGTTPAGPGDPVGLILDQSGNGADASQPTAGARPVYRSADGVQSLELDGSDDALTMTLPAITGGAVVLAGTDGIWIEDDWDFAGGSLSIGPTTVAGLPAGILPVLGNLIGVTIIDRALTSSERAGLVKYYKGRGSKGLFVLGPELVTNGDFSAPEGWIFSGPQSAGASISGGTLNFDGSSTGYGSQDVQQETLAAPGEKLLLRHQAVSVSASNFRINMGTGGATIGPARSVAGTYADIVSPSGSTPGRLNIQAGTGFVGSLDNVSLRKLELQP